MAAGSAVRKRSGWWAASAGFFVIGLVCVVAGIQAQGDPQLVGGPPAPSITTPSSPPSSPTATPDPPTQSPKAPRALPVELEIPVIHVSVPVGRLGLQPDGAVEVPADPARVGWFKWGSSPGEPGAAVILGHVDSSAGPAAFYLLSALHPKDRIDVRLSDGSVTHFAVTGVSVYQNADFPNHKVYSPRGPSALRLVTCGGGYDAESGHYLGNVVIYSALTSISPPPAARSEG